MAVFTSSSTTSGINVTLASSEGLYVASGATLISTGSTAIDAGFSNHEITIMGHVFGQTRGLDLFNGTDAISSSEIVVGKNASLIGVLEGIRASGDLNVVVNRGEIQGLLHGIAHNSGDDFDLVNHGSIDAPIGTGVSA